MNFDPRLIESSNVIPWGFRIQISHQYTVLVLSIGDHQKCRQAQPAFWDFRHSERHRLLLLVETCKLPFGHHSTSHLGERKTLDALSVGFGDPVVGYLCVGSSVRMDQLMAVDSFSL